LTTNKIKQYKLDEQFGFILRQVNQRHTTLFSEMINEKLTPTQFSVLAKLYELKACSQNMLGRYTAMDAATVKGVIDRLRRKELVHSIPDTNDKRRVLVELTVSGKQVAEEAILIAADITHLSLQPLTNAERETFMTLLKKLR